MSIELFNNSTVELVNFTGGDEMVARAAWVSNVGEESKTKDASEIQGLINFLYRNHHNSPFEHGQFTFYVKTPIFVAREYHRHRTMSYNEVSGRYSDMKPRFYIPGEGRPVVQKGKIGSYEFAYDNKLNAKITKRLIKSSERQWKEYMRLKKMGAANEVARMALTVNLMTEFYATVNPRNLMQFLTLRQDPQALYEIRDVADQMAVHFQQQMPLTSNAFNRYKAVTLDDQTAVG